jgi:glycosyltransferase involved in cell wall biosynthesis
LKNKVDIVMPTLIRNIDWLRQSTESVINQPEVQNIFIVVDEIAFSKISELKKIGFQSNVKIIKSEGHGIAHGVNTGIKQAESEFIGRLDDDDISAMGRFKLQIDEIKKYDCDLVFSSLNFIDPLGNISSNIAHQEYSGDFWKDALVFGNFLNHSTLLGKTDFIQNSNLYPLDIRSEDYGFWLSIALNTKIRTLAEELYSYRQHNQQYTKNRIEKDPNSINYNLWKNFGIKLKIPIDLLSLNNFYTLTTNDDTENSIFELLLELIRRLEEFNQDKKNFWSLKLINKLLDKKFNMTLSNDVNMATLRQIILSLFENSISDRKIIGDLGKIGFDLQQQVLSSSLNQPSIMNKIKGLILYRK